ncbi:MAG: hypothetical protein HY040_03365 [Planctomycetes bacterium]|nr:hypothetical protein [Planctomycetota bacterium]
MNKITCCTKQPPPDLQAVLDKLEPGTRIRITQTVRVGMKSWPAVATGVFRHVDSLATGLATHRVPEDDIIVPIIHFTKEPHGELSSVAIDEHTKVEIL